MDFRDNELACKDRLIDHLTNERDQLRHALIYLVQQAKLSDLPPTAQALRHAQSLIRAHLH